MPIRHEINEQEMINIFDQFAALIIDGYPCEELTEYLHESVRELAVDQSAVISKGDFTYILEDFINSFTFDDENGGYNWEYKDACLGMCFKGETKVIRTGVNDARSKAYREFWVYAYEFARHERSQRGDPQQISPMYIIKYTLKAVKKYVGTNAVNLNDAIKMVEKAIELTDSCYGNPILAASELRRLELQEIFVPSEFDNGLPF